VPHRRDGSALIPPVRAPAALEQILLNKNWSSARL
jgi:hypothetical protein